MELNIMKNERIGTIGYQSVVSNQRILNCIINVS
jgi:hypothetical protein